MRLGMLKKISVITAAVLSVLFLYLAGIYAVKVVYPLNYYPIISEKAQKYNLDTAFVCAVIHTESRFDAAAVSNKGASGLMQLIESTALWAAEETQSYSYSSDKIFVPEINIEFGCWYISKLLVQYGNDETLALAAYNAGSGNVAKWLSDELLSPDGESLKSIPFDETRGFVEKINRSREIYTYLIKYRKLIYWT